MTVQSRCSNGHVTIVWDCKDCMRLLQNMILKFAEIQNA